MTLIEIVIVIAVLLVIVVVISPAFRKARVSSGPGCVNSLQQTGLSFTIWSADHQGRFPMQVSTNNGGTKEFVGVAAATFRHFEVMSNELNGPRVLICPRESDKTRRPATVFSPNVAGIPGGVPFNGNRNVSYFLGVDTTPTNATMFLAGDRNITNGFTLKNGLLELKTNQPVAWTKDMHHFAGNILLSDGSAQQVTSQGLRDLLKNAEVETTRLAMP